MQNVAWLLVLLSFLTPACIDKELSPRASPEAEPGETPFSLLWNGTGASEIFLFEIRFVTDANCTLEYSLSGKADNSPLHWMMGIRWPDSYNPDQEWGWGYSGPTGRIELVGQSMGTTLPGLVWVVNGTQHIMATAGDHMAVVFAQFTPLAQFHDRITFTCDRPAEGLLSHGLDPLVVSPGDADVGVAVEGPVSSTVSISKELHAQLPILSFGCYCPTTDAVGFYDLTLQLPTNSTTLHFEGTQPEAVFIRSSPGEASASLTSVSSRSILLLVLAELETIVV